MTNMLKYKDYIGSVEIDTDRGVIRGKLLFMSELITFESASIKKVQAEFEAAVEDYIATCKKLGIEPHKSFTGQFNVRAKPEQHKMLALFAAQDNRSLNGIVVECFAQYIARRQGAELTTKEMEPTSFTETAVGRRSKSVPTLKQAAPLKRKTVASKRSQKRSIRSS